MAAAGIGRHQPGADVQPLLGLQEPGRHRATVHFGQRKVIGPVLQRGLGRAERTRPVDGGGAPDAAALEDGDGLVGRLAAVAVLVELGVGVGLELAEVAAGAERPFFDDDDRQLRLGEQLGGDAGTGAAADDGHVAADLGRRGAVRAAKHLPAPGEAGTDGIGNGVGHRGWLIKRAHSSGRAVGHGALAGVTHQGPD
jgi:hypothetical protein